VQRALSGTFNAAQAGAKLVPEANIAFVDTKTLPAAAGWQVEAAIRVLRANWPIRQILALLKRISRFLRRTGESHHAQDEDTQLDSQTVQDHE
jgi:fatty acid-binding protein DegV